MTGKVRMRDVRQAGPRVFGVSALGRAVEGHRTPRRCREQAGGLNCRPRPRKFFFYIGRDWRLVADTDF
jgi:hypothetical protein